MVLHCHLASWRPAPRPDASLLWGGRSPTGAPLETTPRDTTLRWMRWYCSPSPTGLGKAQTPSKEGGRPPGTLGKTEHTECSSNRGARTSTEAHAPQPRTRQFRAPVQGHGDSPSLRRGTPIGTTAASPRRPFERIGPRGDAMHVHMTLVGRWAISTPRPTCPSGAATEQVGRRVTRPRHRCTGCHHTVRHNRSRSWFRSGI